MVDTYVWGAYAFGVGVQVPPWAPLEFSFQIFSQSPIKDEKDYTRFIYIDFYFDRD